MLSPQKKRACFGEHCFQVSVAESEAARQKGLSGRKKINQDQGMLFVFTRNEPQSIWMKGMRFPLDIIWLDKDKKAIWIKENAEPCEEGNCEIFTSDKDAKFVLEINAGEAKKLGLKIGEVLSY